MTDAESHGGDELSLLARDALAEVTTPASVGPEIGRSEHEGVVDIEFLSEVPGYVGWHWTVTIAQVEDAEPTVVELAMLPGDGALLAPAWVPWAERLAEYRRTHGGGESDADGDDLDDADVDDEDIDDDGDDDDETDDDADVVDPLDHDVDETDLVDDFDDDLDIDEGSGDTDDPEDHPV